ncbi:MAG: glycogen debranching protein GlgX [Xanthomonadales bacterium]|jgi:glycogen operon protein|nr:glycogen debranching protein GlgX [Xanthomonadales bacterium]
MRPPARGAFVEPDGVRFRVWSSCADRVLLCLHAAEGPERERVELTAQGDGDWEVFVPGLAPGQRYGYRVEGPWAPEKGQRCNPAKLLLDPYARQLAGEFHWSAAAFDYTVEVAQDGWRRDERDSAPVVPHGVVTAPLAPQPTRSALHAWRESVVYEVNVRGFTMAHPGLDDSERGRLRGLSNGRIIEYLKALGITTVELMPVHAFIDERHLAERGLRNLWGYNSIGFFAVAPRLAGPEGIAEFRTMVTALHEAGLDVLLDVVYNHTGEGGALGPTLGFRGLDNLAYYRVEAEDPGIYVNDTGTGNTVNVDEPVVQDLVLDSLRYWHRVMGVDGFRFDLAPVLGLGRNGFDPAHPLLTRITSDPELATAQLIAEPWGPAAYTLGQYPSRWSEWNDRYRDDLRRFWNRSRAGDAQALALRVGGSPDVFAARGRGPEASVNFVTAHDGFTLADLVSYERKHNEANGEGNRDGHSHNLSENHGVEGPTERRSVLALRRRHRLNLLASLLFSRGVPMLLAGDELGNSQAGNNNAYAQDNETGWVDWSGLQSDSALLDSVRHLVRLRRDRVGRAWESLTYSPEPAHEGWWHPEGRPMGADDWAREPAALGLLLGRPQNDAEERALVLVLNGHDGEVEVHLPDAPGGWNILYSTDGRPAEETVETFRAAAWSVALLEASA